MFGWGIKKPEMGSRCKRRLFLEEWPFDCVSFIDYQPSTTSLGPWAFRAHLGPLDLGLFCCFVFASSERWEAVLLVLPTLEELEISMNFTSYYHKLGKRRRVLCVRHCGCVISFHPYNSLPAEAVACTFPLGTHHSITYPQCPIAKTCSSLP